MKALVLFLIGCVLSILGMGEAQIVADILRSQNPAALFEIMGSLGVLCIIVAAVMGCVKLFSHIDAANNG